MPDERFVVEKRKAHKRKKRRVVSGAMLEEGDGPALRGLRGGERYNEKHEYNGGRRKKKLCRFNVDERCSICKNADFLLQGYGVELLPQFYF